MTPLRIALVHPYSWPEVRRGAERYLDDLAWYLVGAGHQVDVITGTHGRPSVEQGNPTVRRRRHVKFPGRPRRQLTPMETFAVAAFPQLLRRRYDVVHCMTPTAAVASRLAGQRTIYTVLIHPTHRQYERNPIDRRLTAAGVKAAHAVTALSDASAAATRDVFGRAAEVLAPGVRLDRFPPELAPRAGPPRLLFPADASDQRKCLHVALGALARIAGDHPGIRLQLAGPGDPEWALRFVKDDRATVEPLIEVLGTGELDDVPRRYREATVTVLPSHSEAFGLVLVESLASGTPAVCSRSGGMPEIVDDPAVGRAVAPGDPDALARGLAESIELAARPGTAERCTEHARRWGWRESIGPAHEALYERVMRRRSPR